MQGSSILSRRKGGPYFVGDFFPTPGKGRGKGVLEKWACASSLKITKFRRISFDKRLRILDLSMALSHSFLNLYPNNRIYAFITLLSLPLSILPSK